MPVHQEFHHFTFVRCSGHMVLLTWRSRSMQASFKPAAAAQSTLLPDKQEHAVTTWDHSHTDLSKSIFTGEHVQTSWCQAQRVDYPWLAMQKLGRVSLHRTCFKDSTCSPLFPSSSPSPPPSPPPPPPCPLPLSLPPPEAETSDPAALVHTEGLPR